MRRTFSVAGMHCDGCERSISEALKRVDGVTAVTADHQSGTVVIDGADEVAQDQLRSAIEDAGYDILPDDGRRLPLA